jgi:type IX secretion system PorP/SprF family membrane protein
MKRVLYIIAGFLCIFENNSFGQTEINSSTHWYNRASYNPASIAREGYIYLFSNARKEWIGIKGSPTVYSIQASGFSDLHQSAYGISVIRDDIGVTTAINPTLQYAYLVALKKELHLSLGLSAGVYTRSVRNSAFEAETTNDPVLDYTDQRYTSPDAGVGAELQGKYFLCSLSLTHLISLWKSDDLFLISNHRYAYAIYKNNTSELYNFTAGIQVANRRNLTVVEGSAIIRFKRPTGLIKGPTELFDLGITLRSVKQLTLISGINITSNMRLGYTYDFNFSTTINRYGTHEIVLEYRIPLDVEKDTGFDWYN